MAPEQSELFAAHRHHAFITDSILSLVAADQAHRDQALVEQAIAGLEDGPLAHLPSGTYAANAAWLAHAVIALDLARAADASTPEHRRRATLIINVPARIGATGPPQPATT